MNFWRSPIQPYHALPYTQPRPIQSCPTLSCPTLVPCHALPSPANPTQSCPALRYNICIDVNKKFKFNLRKYVCKSNQNSYFFNKKTYEI